MILMVTSEIHQLIMFIQKQFHYLVDGWLFSSLNLMDYSLMYPTLVTFTLKYISLESSGSQYPLKLVQKHNTYLLSTMYCMDCANLVSFSRRTREDTVLNLVLRNHIVKTTSGSKIFVIVMSILHSTLMTQSWSLKLLNELQKPS